MAVIARNLRVDRAWVGGFSLPAVSDLMRRFAALGAWRLGLLLPLMLMPWLGRADAFGRQVLFQLRGPLPLPDEVVLLGIDETSLDPQLADFGPWPWPRAVEVSWRMHHVCRL